MNKLANLLGQKKESTNEPKEQQVEKAADKAKPESAEAPAQDKPKKPALSGLKLGGAIGKGSKPAAAAATPKPAGEAPRKKSSNELSLDDLENMEDPGTHRPKHDGAQAMYGDHIEATKPIRDVEALLASADDDSKAGMKSFLSLLDGVYEILDDPEMLGNVTRSIMMELKDNPQYMKLVADSDIQTLVRAMRASMGLARIKKTNAKAKRAGGGKSKAKVDQDMLDDLDSLDLGDLG